jgi:hypothetical protein
MRLQTPVVFTRSLIARLSQTDARAPAIFVDELDAGGFESALYYLHRRPSRPTCPAFQLVNGDGANASADGEILLTPTY